MIERGVRLIDQSTGTSPLLRRALRYLFPDHWSFLLGEVALYAFIVLVATGTYLALFFDPSTSSTVYGGSYGPLQGAQMSEAYRSVLDISFQVRAGLLMRQTHHWAADVFVAAIVLHLMRVFFTGAFRAPRTLIYLIGLTLLFTTLLEGYAGYSMVDDLLSGMGLAIGYGVALSIPFVGANLALLIWGAPFPGDAAFESRLFIAHVFIFPALIAVLIGAHLGLVTVRHHTQFRRRHRPSDRRIVGIPAFPGQAPRSIGLMVAVAAVLFLLGGLIQINPIWLWGPFHVGSSTNGAQPDWYLGWLIGALRLMPGFDWTIGNYTVVPNPFWGGVLFPLLVVVVLAAWPWVEGRMSGGRPYRNVLDRPRDAPFRTAFGAGFLMLVLVIFFAGSADRATVTFGLAYASQITVYRVLVFALPAATFLLTWLIARDLHRGDRIDAAAEEAAEEGQRLAAASSAQEREREREEHEATPSP